MSASAIEWTDTTWNPVTGCSKVSAGCANCYAEKLSLRFGWSKKPWTPANAAENVVLHPDRLEQPLHWRKPRMVFVNSMSDLFHERVSFEFVDRVFASMVMAERHIYQCLTKRPERAADYFASDPVPRIAALTLSNPKFWAGWPLPQVWLGVSIENSRFTWRADVLREIPAAVRFISAEPLLGSLYRGARSGHRRGEASGSGTATVSPLGGGKSAGREGDGDSVDAHPALGPAPSPSRRALDLTRIDWVICGGESGPGARPMDLDWARELLYACRDEGVAVFVKQLGSVWAAANGGDRKGGDPDRWPSIFRVREFPRTLQAAA